MKIRRTLAMLLAILMLLCLAAGCSETAGGDENAPEAGQNGQTVSPVEEETEPQKLEPDLPADLDYGGATVVIMQHPFQAGDWADWLSRDIWSDGLTGEPINDA
ncbi:MAG: hypothetical protein IK132_11115, partial [Clostridia bacterium]|nr:hypothetical protein [Clostridia bacterium]